mgnify:CR=1 FL=1
MVGAVRIPVRSRRPLRRSTNWKRSRSCFSPPGFPVSLTDFPEPYSPRDLTRPMLSLPRLNPSRAAVHVDHREPLDCSMGVSKSVRSGRSGLVVVVAAGSVQLREADQASAAPFRSRWFHLGAEVVVTVTPVVGLPLDRSVPPAGGTRSMRRSRPPLLVPACSVPLPVSLPASSPPDARGGEGSEPHEPTQ